MFLSIIEAIAKVFNPEILSINNEWT
uniref:Uncharacterized protein n=1 Tax=Rhizophora mucronata TaxID=61149 RepID=A0A2P2N0T6_RHIMU